MHFLALATDYDGTIATIGRIPDQTRNALGRLKASGRKIILVTGRELPELLDVCPEPEIFLFEIIVAENGALLYEPRKRKTRLLAEPPPSEFLKALLKKGAFPLSAGRVIVSTVYPHGRLVEEAIQEMKLPLEIIHNRDAVMILPRGTDKASGLRFALNELGLSPNQVIGVGDAENDLIFLQECEFSVAVGNALDQLKRKANWITASDEGMGVAEFIDQWLTDESAFVSRPQSASVRADGYNQPKL